MKSFVVLLLTSGLVFGVGYWFVLQPGQVQNERLEVTLIGLQNKTNEGRAALRSLPLFREEVNRLELEREKLLSGVPAGGGLSELLDHLRRISMASGVTFVHHPPSTSSGEDSKIATRITVRGSTRQVPAFFAALSDDEYPFVGDDLRLSPVEGTTGVLQADLVVSDPLEADLPALPTTGGG